MASFSVNPLHWKVTVTPGKEQLGYITLVNYEGSPANFVLTTSGVSEDAQGHPHFGQGIDPAEGWLVPQAKNITLASGEQKKIYVSIKPTADAEPGTHYAALMVKKVVGAESQVSMTGQIAVLMEVDVAGVVHEGLSIEDWTPTKTIFTTTDWTSALSLKNTGTVSVQMAGQVAVTNWLGKTVSTEPVVLGNSLLPGINRQLNQTVAANHLWPGPYRLDVTVQYGASKTTARAEATIWYIPVWSVTALLALAVIVVIGFGLKKRTKL